jgi:hypothetical protein
MKLLIMKFRIFFWDVLPCKIIVDRRFRGTYCLHLWWSTIILHRSTSQKTILIFILAAVRTWNLTSSSLCNFLHSPATSSLFDPNSVLITLMLNFI